LKEGVEGDGKTTAKNAPRASDLFKLAPSSRDTEQSQSLVNKTGRLRNPAMIAPETGATKTAAAGGDGEGQSATDDYLKDVAVGANTLLNTQEFKFYSFYERIRQRLANEWNQRLNSELDQLFAAGTSIDSDKRTKVEVELDERGGLKRVRVVGSSGIEGLDRAATMAFQYAAPFPNPPTDMIEKDRSVRIRWDFVVVADAGNRIHFELRRAPSGF
jgi:protein TonB